MNTRSWRSIGYLATSLSARPSLDDGADEQCRIALLACHWHEITPEQPNARLHHPVVSRPGPGLIHHSDRGSQYACGDYQAALQRRGMLPSMGRKGDVWDNAPGESLFGTLKCELVHHWSRPPRDQARREVFEYNRADT